MERCQVDGGRDGWAGSRANICLLEALDDHRALIVFSALEPVSCAAMLSQMDTQTAIHYLTSIEARDAVNVFSALPARVGCKLLCAMTPQDSASVIMAVAAVHSASAVGKFCKADIEMCSQLFAGMQQHPQAKFANLLLCGIETMHVQELLAKQQRERIQLLEAKFKEDLKAQDVAAASQDAGPNHKKPAFLKVVRHINSQGLSLKQVEFLRKDLPLNVQKIFDKVMDWMRYHRWWDCTTQVRSIITYRKRVTSLHLMTESSLNELKQLNGPSRCICGVVLACLLLTNQEIKRQGVGSLPKHEAGLRHTWGILKGVIIGRHETKTSGRPSTQGLMMRIQTQLENRQWMTNETLRRDLETVSSIMADVEGIEGKTGLSHAPVAAKILAMWSKYTLQLFQSLDSAASSGF